MFYTTVKRAGLLFPGFLWLLMALAGSAAAQDGEVPLEVSDIRICNLRANTFAVSWRTNQPTSDNVLKLGSSPDELTMIREDQLAAPSHIHYVESGLLNVDTTYYYVVSSDGVEGAGSSAGYDSVLTQQQSVFFSRAIIQGSVLNSQSLESLNNVIVRSFYRWSRPVTDGTQVDSTMWQAVLANDDGEFSMNMANFRRYNGGQPPYYAGSTWLFLEILSQSTGEIATDSVLLTFASNQLGELQVLQPYEVADVRSSSPGDVDGNEAINIFDVLGILKIIGGRVAPDMRMSAAADIDANGRIDIFDLLELLKKLRPADTASG